MWAATFLLLGMVMVADCRTIQFSENQKRDVSEDDVKELYVIYKNRTAILRPPKFVIQCLQDGTFHTTVVLLKSNGFHITQGNILSIVQCSEFSIGCVGTDSLTILRAPVESSFIINKSTTAAFEPTPYSQPENLPIDEEGITISTIQSVNDETSKKVYNEDLTVPSHSSAEVTISIIFEGSTKASQIPAEATTSATNIEEFKATATEISNISGTEIETEIVNITNPDSQSTKESIETVTTYYMPFYNESETEKVHIKNYSNPFLDESIETTTNSFITKTNETEKEILTNLPDVTPFTTSSMENVTIISNGTLNYFTSTPSDESIKNINHFTEKNESEIEISTEIPDIKLFTASNVEKSSISVSDSDHTVNYLTSTLFVENVETTSHSFTAEENKTEEENSTSVPAVNKLFTISDMEKSTTTIFQNDSIIHYFTSTPFEKSIDTSTHFLTTEKIKNEDLISTNFTDFTTNNMENMTTAISENVSTIFEDIKETSTHLLNTEKNKTEEVATSVPDISKLIPNNNMESSTSEISQNASTINYVTSMVENTVHSNTTENNETNENISTNFPDLSESFASINGENLTISSNISKEVNESITTSKSDVKVTNDDAADSTTFAYTTIFDYASTQETQFSTTVPSEAKI